MIEFRFKNVVVRSSDEAATEAEASAFAQVLSKNWLEGAPQNEPLGLEATRKNGSIIRYIASIEPSN